MVFLFRILSLLPLGGLHMLGGPLCRLISFLPPHNSLAGSTFGRVQQMNLEIETLIGVKF